MYLFDKVKKDWYGWKLDIKGRYEYELPIIEQIISLIQEIFNIWLQDREYRIYTQKIQLSKMKYDMLNNFDLFYSDYVIILQSESIQKLVKNGYDEHNIKISIINYLIKKYHYLFKNLDEIEKLLIFLQDYHMMVTWRNEYRKMLILENQSLIYKNCLLINSYRKRYPEFYYIIGRYDDTDIKLGKYGRKLLEEDETAIEYINSLESLLVALETEKATIELTYQSSYNR